MMTSLAEVLDARTIEGELYEKLEDNAVRCYACAHRCLIRDGRRGICKVRFNRNGKLYVPWGYVAGLQVDPIEKKPYYHVLPGEDALTFGMLGCDFHCDFCQNYLSSQALRDPASDIASRYIKDISPEEIVSLAVKSGAKIIASSYNEPLITSEWAVSIFKLAVKEGIKCVYVSNGNATPEVLEYLRPYLVAYKIDLKTMQDKQYRQLGGVLSKVLDSIQLAYDMGLWVEVVTLVIPDYNDSTEELMDAARFIKSISPDIPWHVTAFHPDYQHMGPGPTPSKTLLRAGEIGQEAGLNFVYVGNIPGQVEEYENTFCPKCGKLLIRRYSYIIREYHITSEGTCPNCGAKISGIWTDDPGQVRLGGSGIPRWANR
jgi:pyruvate formate lyase activating enzyme